MVFLGRSVCGWSGACGGDSSLSTVYIEYKILWNRAKVRYPSENSIFLISAVCIGRYVFVRSVLFFNSSSPLEVSLTFVVGSFIHPFIDSHSLDRWFVRIFGWLMCKVDVSFVLVVVITFLRMHTLFCVGIGCQATAITGPAVQCTWSELVLGPLIHTGLDVVRQHPLNSYPIKCCHTRSITSRPLNLGPKGECQWLVFVAALRSFHRTIL